MGVIATLNKLPRHLDNLAAPASERNALRDDSAPDPLPALNETVIFIVLIDPIDDPRDKERAIHRRGSDVLPITHAASSFECLVAMNWRKGASTALSVMGLALRCC
ncbi:hypothetical protein N8D56_21335 [Devosia sp. A8/3-2]|nr:hypothetical protein N8D56_21335 [Devosia sp. A8/3-2]